MIGPAAAEVAARRPRRARELAPRRSSSAASTPRAVATDLGVDLIVAADDRRARARRARRRAAPSRSTEEAAEIVRVESGRPRFGREMTTATIPQEAGHQRARGQLHQGLLHRPGDRRPAPLQGQAEPPPARPAARRRPRAAGDRVRLGERELGPDRDRGPLPRPRPDRARDPAPRGRARRDRRGRRRGTEAEVVELPF